MLERNSTKLDDENFLPLVLEMGDHYLCNCSNSRTKGVVRLISPIKVLKYKSPRRRLVFTPLSDNFVNTITASRNSRALVSTRSTNCGNREVRYESSLSRDLTSSVSFSASFSSMYFRMEGNARMALR